MPGTRRSLIDAARGLTGSFSSRNNDYRGAWLPGVLLQRFLDGSGAAVVVDLVQHSDGDDHLTDTIRATYGELLRSVLARTGLAEDVVATASITIDFRPREPNWTREDWLSPRAVLDRPTWWFEAIVRIEDDRGHVHTAADRNWCWPETRRLPIGQSTSMPDGRLSGGIATTLSDAVHRRFRQLAPRRLGR
ncbi:MULTISPECIES: hypothetical protein [unclassified Curtobacterium]|uniref:hypothetical protein n=1 Tax=unclassified Curtobacterium TaxID=257496 RepID=UPI00226B1C0C|nr:MULTISPECIES: hypothetical protein [unclassified Curtobacterium]